MNPPIEPRPLSVLLVEDEPRLRELLVRSIGDMGFPCRGARSAEEALRILEESAADIVILDLNLPGMQGMDFLDQLRQHWPRIAPIILTGFGDLESAKRAIHLDVVEFLTKPCHLGDLEVALDRARRRLAERPIPTKPRLTFQEQTPPPPIKPLDPSEPAKLDDVERQHILAALARHDGNRAATAAELGISLRTLYYRLNQYQKDEKQD